MILVAHDRNTVHDYIDSSAFNPQFHLEMYPTKERAIEAVETLGNGRVLLEDYLHDYNEREVIHRSAMRLAMTGIGKPIHEVEQMLRTTIDQIGEHFGDFIHVGRKRYESKRNESKHGRRDIKRTVKGNQYPLPKRPRGMPKW